jgi:uncharacterized protein YjdB
MRVRSFLVPALIAILVVVACEDEPTRPPPTRFSTTASTATASVTQDDTVRFSVTVRNETANQTIDPTGSFATSLDPSIATVATTSTPGTFRIRGVRPGTARIVTGFAGVHVGTQDTVVVTVAARPVATVTLTPETGQTFADSTFKFTATLRDASGAVITRRPALIFIPESDTAFAEIVSGDTVENTAPTDAGTVTAKQAGTVRIIAIREGKADTSTLTIVDRPVETVEVTPEVSTITVGDTVRLTATLRAVNDAELTGRTITWSSSNPAVASVDDEGLVTGLTSVPGGVLVTITATSEGKSGSAQVIVNP